MISREDILGLAALARLELREGEVESLQKDISDILEYVGQVSAVKADASVGEKPLLRNVMREDLPAAVLGSREELIKAFPVQESGYNVVRKIIQKDE